MNPFRSMLVLVVAVLAVFVESLFAAPRHWLGTQIDLLPALMVYASLSSGLPTITLTALIGGGCFDALSSQPLGVSVLPLFVIGLAVFHARPLILRRQIYAQWILSLAASAVAPPLALLLLFSIGAQPLLGLGSLWQWLVMAFGGSLAGPVFFWLFDWVEGGRSSGRWAGVSFRSDREIARGRS